MDYTKLTEEVRKLYNSFCYAGFDSSQALELTKFCINEFSIFKTMIVDEYGCQV